MSRFETKTLCLMFQAYGINDYANGAFVDHSNSIFQFYFIAERISNILQLFRLVDISHGINYIFGRKLLV